MVNPPPFHSVEHFCGTQEDDPLGGDLSREGGVVHSTPRISTKIPEHRGEGSSCAQSVPLLAHSLIILLYKY